MNKKLLFGIMSLAALAACTNDDFETQNGAQVSEQVSPIQFEVINNAEVTRASMDGNTIKWSAKAGDLFTLYHGGGTFSSPFAMAGYENATYKASEGEGGAVLTTPSVIKEGSAVMVWPADTAFNGATSTAGFYKNGANLAVKIPEVLTNIENNIPYASDLINILPYAAYSETAKPGVVPTAYNTAGKDRKYAVYMRPMASQLILKADYAGTDAKINELAKGADPIDPIALTSVDIVDPKASLTQGINLIFKDKSEYAKPAAGTNWKTVENNSWQAVTDFDLANVTKVGKLSTKCIDGIESAKFLILPQNTITGTGLTGASVVVNTIYGKVEIGSATYTKEEQDGIWYRYAASGDATYGETAGTGSDAGKVKTSIEKGLAQVIDVFSSHKTTKETSVVVGEPTGAVGTRYVKVLLTKLNMDGLHVTSDKQLYDAVRVWKEIGAKEKHITVYLDGDKGNFEISKKTIAKINEINAATAEEDRSFKVMPCQKDGEKCETIVITGGDEIPADLTFIVANAGAKVPVALNKGENWKWNSKNVMVDKAATTGVSKIINRGTLVSDANATLKIFDNTSADPKKPNQIYTIGFENDGEWDITAGTLYVQFDVTNNGIVNIAKGAQYRQDGKNNDFTNEATTLPDRFFTADQKKKNEKEQIGLVNNSGVFATVNDAEINNYGLIEHADKDAKTYITSNQKGDGFGKAFNSDSEKGAINKMGRINLPYSNKDEDNISINAAADQGFVSVTVTSDNAPSSKQLDASKVGKFVNYVIINSGIEEITNVNDQVQYIEFNDKDKKEIAWMPRFDKEGKVLAYSYTGLIVFSDVNIKLNTKVTVTGSTYIASDMYVGGKFTPKTYDGYFGNTAENAKTMYITY